MSQCFLVRSFNMIVEKKNIANVLSNSQKYTTTLLYSNIVLILDTKSTNVIKKYIYIYI